MFIDALYTIVDSMFLSQYSQVAFEAVGISFPMVMIKISLALGIGVGANVFISRKLGEGDREGADNVARTAVFLSIIGSLLFVALAFTVSVPFMKLFTEDAEMIDMGNEYLIYMLGLSVFSVVSIVAQKLLQATGNMKAPMVSQALGAIVNIILDPIFIFDEFWGMKCLNMGVAGAAAATVLAEFSVPAVQFVYLRKELPYAQYLKTTGVYCLFGLVMAGAVVLLGYVLPLHGWGKLAVQVTGGAAVYGALCLTYWKLAKRSDIFRLMRRK